MVDDMKRIAAKWGAVPALALALLAPAGEAGAATACGTVITNVASATMTSGFPDFIAYEISYNATATIMVLCPPVIGLRKFSSANFDSFLQSPAGGTVTFMICIDNSTSDSVWGVTVTDRMPANVMFVSTDPFSWNVGGTLGAPSYSSNNSTWSATPASPGFGQGAPYYLRWTFNFVGPTRSSCVSYAARIL